MGALIEWLIYGLCICWLLRAQAWRRRTSKSSSAAPQGLRSLEGQRFGRVTLLQMHCSCNALIGRYMIGLHLLFWLFVLLVCVVSRSQREREEATEWLQSLRASPDGARVCFSVLGSEQSSPSDQLFAAQVRLPRVSCVVFSSKLGL